MPAVHKNNAPIIPPALKPGAPVVFVATARRIAPQDISYAREYFEAKGHPVLFAPGIFNTHGRFAGNDEERLQGLQWALDHPSAGAVICCRGGYGTSRLLAGIDLSGFARHPKWVAGFSDVTALLLHLNAQGFAGLHATMPLVFSTQGSDSVEQLYATLTGHPIPMSAAYHPLNRLGTATGPLLGGNLSLIAHLIGTASMPATAGSILFIEDLDEYLYHADRMLVQLDRAGILPHLAGLVAGSFTGMMDHENEPYGQSIHEIILERVSKYRYPVAFGLPAGHASPNMPLVMRAEYSLSVSAEKTLLQLI